MWTVWDVDCRVDRGMWTVGCGLWVLWGIDWGAGGM